MKIRMKIWCEETIDAVEKFKNLKAPDEDAIMSAVIGKNGNDKLPLKIHT